MPDPYMPRMLTREDRVLPGEKRVVPIPSPAAGADWSVTVPGGRQWRLAGGSFQLVTSATVASRYAPVLFSIDGIPFFIAANNVATTASSTSVFVLQPAYSPDQGAQMGVYQPQDIPRGWLLPGTTIASNSIGLQAGDQYSAIQLVVEEAWMDDQMLTTLQLEVEAAERAALQAAAGRFGGPAYAP